MISVVARCARNPVRPEPALLPARACCKTKPGAGTRLFVGMAHRHRTIPKGILADEIYM
jgi:hypothetical protein